eukprot:gb/GEZN01007754.1/.p1 GENE.gb/GEZN01007754.1/~~gb/GEZN01007754.1/.p1  ORF type:complete len:353 (-),score=35.64 gb/GEZN01007754.1/:419-1477(-)
MHPSIEKLIMVFVLALASSSIFLAVCEFRARGSLPELGLWLFFWMCASTGTKVFLGWLAKMVCVIREGDANLTQQAHNRRKFAESGAFLLGQHIPVTFFCLYCFYLTNNEWRGDPKVMLTPWVVSPVDPLLDHFYISQVAAWSWGLFQYLFFEVPDKNHLLMTSHHCVTIFLITISLMLGGERFGVAVLYVHCASDIFVSTMKAAHHAGFDMDTSGIPIAEGFFAANLLIWAYFRLYLFPFWIIKAGALYSDILMEDPRVVRHSALVARVVNPGNISYYHKIMVMLMVVLMCMSIFWYLLLVRIAYNLLAKGEKVTDAAKNEFGPDAGKNVLAASHTNKNGNHVDNNSKKSD